MNMKKKMLALCLVVVMIVAAMPVSQAVETAPDANPAMTKEEFANYCHTLNQSHTRVSRTALSDREADMLLVQYANSKDAYERAEIEAQLNNAGHYIYTAGPQDQIMPYGAPSNVTLSNVTVSYNDNTGNWSLVGGGYWNTLEPIKDEANLPIFWLGQEVNIGGLDAVGIVITNTSGSTPKLLSSYATITDREGSSYDTTTASTAETNKGIGFQYQDRMTITKTYSFSSEPDPTKYDCKYMGNGFSAVMRFDSSFMKWNGTARTFYAHTWSSTTINSIGFGAGATSANVSISWSTNSHNFLGYSNGDTTF